MAIATIQILRSRAWFLWALTSAAMCKLKVRDDGRTTLLISQQCNVLVSSPLLYIHRTEQTISHFSLALQRSRMFATCIGHHRTRLIWLFSFAPLLFSVAVYTTFSRLTQTVMPEHVKRSKNMWVMFTQHPATFVLVPSLVPLALFGFGIYNIGKFLSPAPIDDRNAAFGRLLSYELGISQLQKAHAAQAFICVVFGTFAGIFTAKSKTWEIDALCVRNKNWRELLHTINFVNGLIFTRTCYKVLESQAIATSKASLGDNGPLFWVFDVLPMLTALVFFCAVRPTSYLPDHVSSVVLDPEALYIDEKQ